MKTKSIAIFFIILMSIVPAFGADEPYSIPKQVLEDVETLQGEIPVLTKSIKTVQDSVTALNPQIKELQNYVNKSNMDNYILLFFFVIFACITSLLSLVITHSLQLGFMKKMENLYSARFGIQQKEVIVKKLIEPIKTIKEDKKIEIKEEKKEEIKEEIKEEKIIEELNPLAQLQAEQKKTVKKRGRPKKEKVEDSKEEKPKKKKQNGKKILDDILSKVNDE